MGSNRPGNAGHRDRPYHHEEAMGAFYGTELDLQLRRRGIDTIVLCGIATELGVDTTAREAFMHGYQLILAIDAMTGFSETGHDYVKISFFHASGVPGQHRKSSLPFQATVYS